MDHSLLSYRVETRIAEITLSRPEKRNALNDALIGELTGAFSQAGKNSEVKVVIVTGSGQSFCAGADLEYLQKLSTDTLASNQEDSRKLMKLFQLIYEMRKPVIAMVNGPALAGGCGLATVCDFIVASREHAQFGYPEVKIGFLPALVMVFLVKKLGEGRARELVLTGRIIDAEEAHRAGLVTLVADHDRLVGVTREFAHDLSDNNSANSMALTKEMLAALHHMDFSQALDYAANMNAVARMTDDCKKGISAFLKKEQIRW